MSNRYGKSQKAKKVRLTKKKRKEHYVNKERTLNKKFKESSIPEFNQELFMEEFAESGYKFSILRKWMYYKFGVNPVSSNDKADNAIEIALSSQGATVDVYGIVQMPKGDDNGQEA